jgi:hypothetical protein
MARRHRSFDSSDFDESFMDDEDVDPRSSVANLADVMLVFAMGLMVALVAHWNISINSVQQVEKQQDMTEVTDVEKMADDMTSGGGGYTQLGTVYQDPTTGKMYMLQESSDDTSTPTDSSTATAGS